MKNVVAVVLAAGQSTRMNSATSKLLHRIGGKYLIDKPVEACEQAGVSRIILVVGHQGEDITNLFKDRCEYVHQYARRGTGDALKQALAILQGFNHDLLVLPGDAPFLGERVLRQLVAYHRQQDAVATVLTARIRNPASYGRIVRGSRGQISRIVEFKNATPHEKAIREVNSGVYCFAMETLRCALHLLRPNDVTGEEYLTDVVGLFTAKGHSVAGLLTDDSRVVLGINTPEELAYAQSLLVPPTTPTKKDAH